MLKSEHPIDHVKRIYFCDWGETGDIDDSDFKINDEYQVILHVMLEHLHICSCCDRECQLLEIEYQDFNDKEIVRLKCCRQWKDWDNMSNFCIDCRELSFWYDSEESSKYPYKFVALDVDEVYALAIGDTLNDVRKKVNLSFDLLETEFKIIEIKIE